MKSEQQLIEKLILSDISTIRNLYSEYQSKKQIDSCTQIYNQLVWEICRDCIAKEIVLYPMIRKFVPNGDIIVDDALSEGRKIKDMLSELQGMEVMSPGFEVKLSLMMDSVFQKMNKMQKDILPLVSSNIPKEDRISAGAKYENRKLIAPTRPHTLVSDQYPWIETIQSLLIAPLDKFIDLFKDFPEQKSDIPKPSKSEKTTSQ